MGSEAVRMSFNLGGMGIVELADRNTQWSYGNTTLPVSNCQPLSDGTMGSCSPSNAGKISQASANIRMGSDEEPFDINLGMGYFKGGSITSFNPDDGFLPKSYTGFDLRGTWQNIHYSGALVTGMMKDGQETINKLSVIEDRDIPGSASVDIDYAASVGLQTTLAGVGYKANFSHADRYKVQCMVGAQYALPLEYEAELIFDLAYHHNRYGGSKWVESVAKGIHSATVTHGNLSSARIRYSDDPWRLALAYSRRGGKEGRYDRNLAGVGGAWWHYAKSFLDKFDKTGTQAAQLRIGYKLDQFTLPVIRNMEAAYWFTYGDRSTVNTYGIDQSSQATEHVIALSYSHPEGMLAGAGINITVAKLIADPLWLGLDQALPADASQQMKFELALQLPIY